MRKANPELVVERYVQLRNLERTGREFGITRERVRQIETDALSKLSQTLQPDL